MKTKLYSLLGVSFAACALAASAATYNGNGDTGFGGPVGTGSLRLTDDGTTVSGTFTRGSNPFNDVLVLYLDSASGGFADTSGFADGADGLRKAISGFDGSANRSLLTFISTFRPEYAIALGPASDSFGGLWQLANGGNSSLIYKNSVNLNPTGNNASPTYTFSFSLADIGLTPGAGQAFGLFGTYISNSGYRSSEAIAGTESGTQGWNPFTQLTGASYTTTAVPEPTTGALLGLSGLSGCWAVRRM